MPPAKWKYAHPNCAAIAKNEAGLVEHWEEFHFEEDYPGPLKNSKASKALTKSSSAKAAASHAAGTVNDTIDPPVAPRGTRVKGGQKALAMAGGRDEEFKGEDGGDEMDLDNEPRAADDLDEEMGFRSNRGTTLTAASKRKATGSPSTSAPPSKKTAARASTSTSTPKNILALLHATKTSTPRTPATRRGPSAASKGSDDDTPDIRPRTLGARAIARLTEKASNDPSRDLQPIRRPLPPRFQEWSSDSDSDIGAHDSSSSDDEPSLPPPPPTITLANPQVDPFYNQDLSDSDASAGISEDEDGTPRPYDPSQPGPDPLHPFSTSAKYRVMPPRGIVKNADGSTIDFDACMTFPDLPDPAVLNKKATMKMKGVRESVVKGERKVVLMSFSDNIATPEMNWAVRRKGLSSPNNPNTNPSSTSYSYSNPDAIGEPLSPPLHPSGISLSTTGDAIMHAYIEANNRAKLKAKEKKERLEKAKGKGVGEVKKKKKASRLPKYEKRKYTWKDNTRKNKGRLYDSRKAGKDAEGEVDGGEGEGGD
ncbi:hypothetical protein DL98DRAFT_572766 [Cadophora sp. DSE1049]|nr:hypothetical protein DL98DRAFT_572766 [Cadophora sp. DSE1049]